MVRLAIVVLVTPLATISTTASVSSSEPSPRGGSTDEYQRVVVSTSQGRFDERVDNHGWWATTLSNEDDNDNYGVGDCEGLEDCPRYARIRNFFTFRLPPLQRSVVAARLVLRRCQGRGGVNETLDLYDVRTPARRLNNNNRVDLGIYRDLGTGTRYGRFRVATAGDGNSLVGFWLNAAAIADINAARGSYFSIGGTLPSAARSNGRAELLFGSSQSRGIQELRLFVRKPSD
jgi:hypothetical protein